MLEYHNWLAVNTELDIYITSNIILRLLLAQIRHRILPEYIVAIPLEGNHQGGNPSSSVLIFHHCFTLDFISQLHYANSLLYLSILAWDTQLHSYTITYDFFGESNISFSFDKCCVPRPLSLFLCQLGIERGMSRAVNGSIHWISIKFALISEVKSTFTSSIRITSLSYLISLTCNQILYYLLPNNGSNVLPQLCQLLEIVGVAQP